MVTIVPVAIFAGVTATVFFTFYAFWSTLNQRATARVSSLADRLDRAGITMGAQEIVLTVAGLCALVWIAFVFGFHTGLVLSLILLPVIGAAGALGFYSYVDFRIGQRLSAFVTQLEPATRLIAGALRVGLGLRQALAIVVDELPDPARHEFRRVIAATNVGASIYDAIDGLAQRMPSHESVIMARVFRVQAETGGDLARILDQLADTIKDRRQIYRKISALTSEGRMSAWVLMLIPVALALFIFATQPAMGRALLYTGIGHVVLITIIVLECCAYLWLSSLLRVRV